MSQAEASLVAYGRDLEHERALTDRARVDRAAFAELYRAHVGAVHGFAYRISGSREVAEEATSATFERALRSIASFEWRGGGVRPWLLRIASNEVNEIYRRTARATRPRAQVALRALAATDDDPTTGATAPGDADELTALRRALATLNPRYREAITIRYLGEMSADDAAAAMDCSKAVLAVTLHRALGALRRAMQTELATGGVAR